MIFSVIIPVYNVKDYLEKCVDSVLAQNCEQTEILLIDDGSTDGVCPAICDRYAQEYPDLIRTIHKPNGGLGDARNVGIRAAKGDYLAFVDSDDYLMPGFLDAMRALLDEFHCDIVDFGFEIVNEHGDVLKRLSGEMPTREPLTLNTFPDMLCALPNTVRRIYRRSLFTDENIWFPPRAWYEDIRTTPKLFAIAGSMVSVPESYYAYLVREGSITRNTNVDRNAEILDAFNDLESWFTQRGLWESYRTQFTRLAVDHILLAASVRVLRVDPTHPLLDVFQQYLSEHYPDYRNSPALDSLPKQHKLILRLLDGKHYRLIRALFSLKDLFK